MDSETKVITSDCEDSLADELASILGLTNDSFAADGSSALKVMETYDRIKQNLTCWSGAREIV
jgi:hypothetical protein